MADRQLRHYNLDGSDAGSSSLDPNSGYMNIDSNPRVTHRWGDTGVAYGQADVALGKTNLLRRQEEIAKAAGTTLHPSFYTNAGETAPGVNTGPSNPEAMLSAGDVRNQFNNQFRGAMGREASDADFAGESARMGYGGGGATQTQLNDYFRDAKHLLGQNRGLTTTSQVNTGPSAPPIGGGYTPYQSPSSVAAQAVPPPNPSPGLGPSNNTTPQSNAPINTPAPQSTQPSNISAISQTYSDPNNSFTITPKKKVGIL